MKKIPPIKVFAARELDVVEEARLQMKAAAMVLHGQAADAHAEGMYLEAQSSRLEQLAELLEDAEVLKVRDLLVSEGALEIEDVFETTAPGGLA